MFDHESKIVFCESGSLKKTEFNIKAFEVEISSFNLFEMFYSEVTEENFQ